MNLLRERVVAVSFALLLTVGALWVWSVAPDQQSSTGSFVVYVLAPDGSLLANGTVVAGSATALSVLEGLAEIQGFDVGIEWQGGFGLGCSGSYVRSIAGIGETQSGGWNYYTRQAGENWVWQPESAACHGLARGAQVEWCWVEADVCRHHVD